MVDLKTEFITAGFLKNDLLPSRILVIKTNLVGKMFSQNFNNGLLST